MFLAHLTMDISGLILGFSIWQLAKSSESKVGKTLIICALFVFVNYIAFALGIPGKMAGILWGAEIVGLSLGWLAGKRKGSRRQRCELKRLRKTQNGQK